MGTRITVVSTGQQFEPLDLTQIEDVFTTNVSVNDGGIPMTTVVLPPNLDYTSLVGESVTIESSTLGVTSGIITDLTVDNSGAPTATLNTKLNPLVRLARAKPFVGTLRNLLGYYFKLGGITENLQWDSNMSNPTVNAQGWEGIIWEKLVKLQQVYQFEIALVSDLIYVRPWRVRTADIGHIFETEFSYTSMPISRTIEIDYFSNTKISNKLVYPVNGVKDDSIAISADARETIEVEIPISASVSSIKQPQFRTTISDNYRGSESIFSVMDKDGKVISAAEWTKYKGLLSVKIGPESTSLIVTFRGLNKASRAPYKVAFAPVEEVADDHGGKTKKPNMDRAFNSLYIVGSGVAFTQRTVSLNTGARAKDIVEEVGATVSDPAISTMGQLCNAALPLLAEASGGKIVLSGSIARINQRGQTNALVNVPVGDVEELLMGQTYGSIEDVIHASETFGDVEYYYSHHLLFEFDNQAFGNAAGARVWDPDTYRWYRITSATISMTEVQFTAESDLLVGDVEEWVGDNTYGYLEDTLWPNTTYWDVELRGLR